MAMDALATVLLDEIIASQAQTAAARRSARMDTQHTAGAAPGLNPAPRLHRSTHKSSLKGPNP